MLRIAVSKDGRLFFDEKNSAGGRGMYICRDVSCMEKARKNKGFARAARRAVSADSIEELAAAFEKGASDE